MMPSKHNLVAESNFSEYFQVISTT